MKVTPLETLFLASTHTHTCVAVSRAARASERERFPVEQLTWRERDGEMVSIQQGPSDQCGRDFLSSGPHLKVSNKNSHDHTLLALLRRKVLVSWTPFAERNLV